MKKLIIAGSVLMLIGVFGVAPVARADTLGDLQNLINKLRDQVSSLRQIAATGGGLENSGSGGFVPPIGYCPAGTVGAGRVNETLRCNGSKWVASGNLVNDGTNVGIGWLNAANKLSVFTTEKNQSAIEGRTVYDGAGLSGYALDNGMALSLFQGGRGYGVYQEGANAKNYFEGKLGFGTANNPQESVDLGGGNIKMGYEFVTNQANNTSSVSVQCPFGKYILGGGCDGGGSMGKLQRAFPHPTENRYYCLWDTAGQTVLAYATCANIR